MERNVKIYIIIINFLTYFSTNNNKIDLSHDFINFFKTYFNEKDFTEEIDLNLRFYVSILQSYIEYLKIPNKELTKEWDNYIKPFILKKYPFQQDGIFNINADIKFLIQEIDSLNKKGNNALNIYGNKINNIYINKNSFNDKMDIKPNYIKNKNISRQVDLSPINLNNINIEKEQEESEKDINIINIDNFKLKKEEKNIINYSKNENNIIIDDNLKGHSSTIGSKSTSISSINDDLNKNEIIEDNLKNNIKIREITQNYHDEFETEGVTIVHKKYNKKILSKMTYNLILKKIIINNFYEDYIIYVTNFAEQCFYFIKKDIIFKKIINCYKYYTELKVPFNQRRNLIYFLNLLIIKMYAHFTKIDFKDEVLIILKNFYNNIINEIKQVINKSKKTSEKIQEFLFEGFNSIKQGINNINRNIKNNFEKSFKMVKNNNNTSKLDNTKNNKEKKDIKENNNKNNLNKIDKKGNDIINNDKNINNKDYELFQNEELLKECEKIIELFKIESPKNEMLIKLEKSLYIFILKVKFKIKINKSRNIERALTKSYSQMNFGLKNYEEKNIKKKEVKKNFFYCLEWSVSDIGEELLYVSQTTLNTINRKELYNGIFLKSNKNTECPGIMENINKFNKLILFIIEDILSYDLPQTRARIIEKWAYVADYCIKRKDYNDTFAINSALKNYIITGLDLTWKEIGNKTKKLIKDIDNFCTFDGNYKNVREDIKLLSRNDFYTPYLGLLLKDLNFYEENYKYLVNGNLINFDKINGVQGAIDEFFHFQKTVDKKVTILPDELNFFENLESKKESELEKLAQKLEPKFILYSNPTNRKRFTIIDKKYFRCHSTKNILKDI